MSDTLVAKGSESKFRPHDEGQFLGQCVDVIDLGQKVHDFPGTPSYLAPTCAMVFRTGEKNAETGDFIDIAREFTVSMSDKANLRKFLEQWRGKPYEQADVDQGVPLHKLTGQFGLLTISHKKSGKGRTYANITACVGVPKQMRTGQTSYVDDYTRDPYWATKKKEYAEAAPRFRGEATTAATEPDTDEFDGFPEETDDLPF